MSMILAIESAIRGGSLCLCDDEAVIAATRGTENVSRAEELLVSIQSLLATAGIERTAIDKIAVSVGPGSYTGIRIGIATAMGLATALMVPLAGISMLQAIAATAENDGEIAAAVKVRNNEAAWQKFRKDSDGMIALNDPAATDYGSFVDLLETVSTGEMIIENELAADLSITSPRTVILPPDQNFARLIADAVRQGFGGRASALYLRGPAARGVGFW